VNVREREREREREGRLTNLSCTNKGMVSNDNHPVRRRFLVELRLNVVELGRDGGGSGLSCDGC